MGLFRRRGGRQGGEAPAPGTGAASRDEQLYDALLARADELRDACVTAAGRRFVAALEWPWVMTAGGGLAEPPAPDTDVVVAVLTGLGETPGREQVEAFVAAEHALFDVGVPRRPDPERARFRADLPELPVVVPDLAYGPHQRLVEAVTPEVRALNQALGGGRVDVEDLAGCLRWWPGRDRNRPDPLHIGSFPRSLDSRVDVGDVRTPYLRLMELQTRGLGEPIEPERWILAAFARRSSALGGLREEGNG
jgi:hypothetical protein